MHSLSFDGSAPQPVSGHSYAPTGLATGVHSVRLRVVDPLGNYAEKTLAFRFGPAPSITSLTWNHTSLAWTDSEALAHTHYLSIDGGVTQTVPGHGFTPTGLATGAHTARLRVVDPLGNAAEKTLSFYAGTPVIARIGGSDRYRVAAAVSATGFATASRVVLVSGLAWPDAISAAPLARAMSAPVLATRGDLLSPAAAAEISRLRATRVTIVGGTGSVSDAVAAQLRRRGLAVDRVAGADRYETAARVAARLVAQRGSIESSTAVVVSGERFNEGIPAGAVAARKGWPLLLTRAGSVPLSTKRALTSMRAARTVVVGTPTRVSNTVFGALPGPLRIAGPTDASVPGALDAWARSTYPTAFPGTGYAIVSANASADGLTAASYASASGTIVLLTPWSLNLDTAKVLSAGKGRITRVVIIGGPASVSPDTEQLIAPYVTP
jgi:putative cell wall-binding protein